MTKTVFCSKKIFFAICDSFIPQSSISRDTIKFVLSAVSGRSLYNLPPKQKLFSSSFPDINHLKYCCLLNLSLVGAQCFLFWAMQYHSMAGQVGNWKKMAGKHLERQVIIISNETLIKLFTQAGETDQPAVVPVLCKIYAKQAHFKFSV